MKDIDEMIEVMQAYKNGEQIEFCYTDEVIKVWEDTNGKPLWNWGDTDYRVKPKPKYVPFDTPDEFLEAQRVHGEVLVDKKNGVKMTAYVNKNGIVACAKFFSNTWMVSSLQNILRDYRFKDGTPCGKIID